MILDQKRKLIKANKPSVTGWSLEDRSESGEWRGSGSFKFSKCIKGS